MAINSKAKGNAYERKIIKIFQDFIKTHKYSENVRFERTAASGGLSEQGDIQCVSGKWFGKRFVRDGYINFPFGIECKNTKTINLERLFNDVSHKGIAAILDQVEDEEKKLNKPVLLIMNIKNVKDDLVCLTGYKSRRSQPNFGLSDCYDMTFNYKNRAYYIFKLPKFLTFLFIEDIINNSITNHFEGVRL